ncbi:disease resistance protein RGH5 [Striga asiatica]|uniref:Disease resistance protein RGH5 n=1 Tax=Striga asiatica TaxID=4170 RepID=A0A5A7RBD6_STRAF|nr:disease resistance protein RGH5 [Striga asiatica]
MAAYGTLLSLTNTIDQILNHPRPPISLDKQQIKPLIEKVAFLQVFLENYIIDDEDGLEGRMVDAAHEAEDIIESHIADHFENEYEDSLYRYIQKMMVESDASHEAEDNEARGEANISSKDDNESLYGELQKVIHHFDSITKDVHKKAWKKIAPSDDAMLGSDVVVNDIMDKINGPSNSTGDESFMNDIMDKLTNQQSSRWIIAITGMGGIGKTTLAKRIYENPLVVEQFDIRGWATVSQEFDSKRILLQVLDCLKKTMGSEESEYEELGQKLYQSLYGRRYLIVMDDIWGTDAWDGVKRFFPKNNGGSRVLITTRAPNVACQLDGTEYFQMRFLNQNESWNLLRRCVFGEQGCPLELEEIGEDIARKCRGLPLSIVMIGGLLAKSEQTHEKWQRVAENLSSIVNLGEDEHCFRILKLSYNQLPVHLKPCFLYMGIFPEDDWIPANTLIRLWVAEGFVKPVGGKSMETTARVVHLHDLVIRNLIMVRTLGPSRRIKCCGIHDLLRDLCIKEAEKYKFFRSMETTIMHNNPEQISWRAQRRIAIHEAGKYIPCQLPKAVRSASRARTLIWNVDRRLPSVVPLRLLRVLNQYTRYTIDGPDGEGKVRLEDHFHLVNLRHLVIKANLPELEFPPEFYLLWNLQTIIIYVILPDDSMTLVLDIWRMPQLRHVSVNRLHLTDPPPPPVEEFKNGCMVLENLETLKSVRNLRLGKELVERIPNIRNLGLSFQKEEEELSLGDYGVNNLSQLHKLEHLFFTSHLSRRIEVTTFPISLRKLFLRGLRLGWEEMGTKIGSLPYLEYLDLYMNAFVGPEWETADGGFRSLKYLRIYGCNDLEQWKAEATHFPCLEQLDLCYLDKLKEIPLEIGDIPTLRKIYFDECSDTVVLSAYKILEEQEGCLGETNLKIDVRYGESYELIDGKLTVTRSGDISNNSSYA